MFDPFRESREEQLLREEQIRKESKEAAEQQLRISQQAFIFGDLRVEILSAFKNSKSVFVYDETDDGSYTIEFDMDKEELHNDIMASSFKLGDRFYCRVRESSKDGRKEVWLQYKINKTFVNLYDVDRYFEREVDGIKMFIFVKSDGVGVLLASKERMSSEEARKLLGKTTKSIISYDDHGYTSIKKSARK